jgi:anaerobic magnesium-protoporphyrin IX monomethyl ester cyclase
VSVFKHICLLKAPQAFELPHAQDVSDLTEICYLAAFIQPHVETVAIPVHFYDLRAYEKCEHYLKTHPVDLVGISSMTGAINCALRLARMAKARGAYVVMGGYHPSALPRDVLASPDVDAVVIGEGELTFRDLVLNGPSRNVKGLAFKENGEVVVNEPRELIENLDALPHPLRSIRPPRADDPGDQYCIDTVYTSRGCFRRCAFCANDVINKTWRARSPENVVEELAMLHDRRRRKLIKIWDANFMTDIKRVEAICDLMFRERLTNFRIWTETSINDIVRAEHIIPKLFEAGLRSVSLGIESPNLETLKLMNKGGNIDQCGRAVEILYRHSIKPQGYFIIGNYNETEEDTRRYPEYAEQLRVRNSIFMVMTPYPGTSIFDEFKKRNLIRSFDWDLYNNFSPVVETQSMDVRTLKRLYAWCWGRFYVQRAVLEHPGTFELCADLIAILLPLYILCRMDKSNTPEDMRDYLLEVLRAAVGTDFVFRDNRPPSKLLQRFGAFGVRFVKTREEAVEVRVMSRDGLTYFSVREAPGRGLFPGPTVHLEKVIRLGEFVRPERFVMLSLKLEAARLNPRGRFRRVFWLCRDRQLFAPTIVILWFLLRLLVGGIVNLRLCPWLGRMPKPAEAPPSVHPPAGPPPPGKRAVAVRAAAVVGIAGPAPTLRPPGPPVN